MRAVTMVSGISERTTRRIPRQKESQALRRQRVLQKSKQRTKAAMKTASVISVRKTGLRLSPKRLLLTKRRRSNKLSKPPRKVIMTVLGISAIRRRTSLSPRINKKPTEVCQMHRKQKAMTRMVTLAILMTLMRPKPQWPHPLRPNLSPSHLRRYLSSPKTRAR